MLKYLRFSGALLLCLPLTSQAALYTLEYSGHISKLYAEGMGYQLGDSISGTLQIDVSRSPGDSFPEDPIYAQYDAQPGSFDFISGYPAAEIGDISQDYIRVFNGYTAGAPSRGNDGFVLGDVVKFSGPENRTYALELNITRAGVDWLSDDSLSELQFSGGQLSGSESYGSFSRRFDYTAADGVRWTYNDQALFTLDSFKFASAYVPEPGPLGLLFGGAALWILRRKLS